MSNELAQCIRIFSSLVRDVEEMHFHVGIDLSKDLERVTSAAESRGLRIFLLDLPSLCKALECALESGIYFPEVGSLFSNKGYPTIFRGLYSKIFAVDLDWSIRSDASALSVANLRQLFKFAKKLRVDPPADKTQEKILEFQQIEEDLPTPRLTWGRNVLRCRGPWPHLNDVVWRSLQQQGLTRSVRSEDRELVSELMQFSTNIQILADHVLGKFQFRKEWFKPKHGPGAVSDQWESSKFEFPTWSERLEHHFPLSDWGIPSWQIWSESNDTTDTSNDVPARLIGVPKDYSGPRLIASEPTSSQFVQQGLLSVLRKNVQKSVLHHCVDFKSQEHSRDLALMASWSRDHSTIDLSSASDRLSCAVVECLFRGSYPLLEKLNAARTSRVLYPDGCVSSELKKFAAQGAAFTFPVQTLTYAIICMAGCMQYRDATSNTRQGSSPSLGSLVDIAKVVRVFGDDMIVPTHVYPLIVRMLEVLHLKVNSDKSFSKGYFRESCGMDAFAGVDVTPASYLEPFNERKPTSLVSVVESANNFFLRGYKHTSTTLQETIPRKYRDKILRKGVGSTMFGFIVDLPINTGKTRYNTAYQRSEMLCLVVEARPSKSAIHGHHRLHQWFIEKPLPSSVWKAGEVIGVSARYRQRWVPII